MLVRLATVEDADALAAARSEVAAEGGWIATEAPVDLSAAALGFHAAAVSTDHALWVLERDGAVVGCAHLRPTAASGVAALGMLIVAPARGVGGGRALLGAVLEHARAADLHKVELEVWPENARAVALYAGAGFTVEGLRRDHYRRRDGGLRSALIMALAL